MAVWLWAVTSSLPGPRTAAQMQRTIARCNPRPNTVRWALVPAQEMIVIFIITQIVYSPNSEGWLVKTLLTAGNWGTNSPAWVSHTGHQEATGKAQARCGAGPGKGSGGCQAGRWCGSGTPQMGPEGRLPRKAWRHQRPQQTKTVQLCHQRGEEGRRGGFNLANKMLLSCTPGRKGEGLRGRGAVTVQKLKDAETVSQSSKFYAQRLRVFFL